LLVDEEDVSEGGALWVDSSTLVPSDTMKHLLEAVSPFCRHCKCNSQHALLWQCK
jgi:hypothetical protein